MKSGVHASDRYAERLERVDGNGLRPYLAVAAHPLSEIKMGESCEVGLKDPTGGCSGVCFVPWEWGEKGEIVESKGGWGGGGFPCANAE